MSLFHYTRIENLKSIREHGILSLKTLGLLNIGVFFLSNARSRELDADKNLQNYVHLTPIGDGSMPMLGSVLRNHRAPLESLVRLTVSEEVMDWPNTWFSNTNVASLRAKLSDDRQLFDMSNDVQKEVLVPDFIDCCHIDSAVDYWGREYWQG